MLCNFFFIFFVNKLVWYWIYPWTHQNIVYIKLQVKLGKCPKKVKRRLFVPSDPEENSRLFQEHPLYALHFPYRHKNCTTLTKRKCTDLLQITLFMRWVVIFFQHKIHIGTTPCEFSGYILWEWFFTIRIIEILLWLYDQS